MSQTNFHFVWDSAKAVANFRKHGVRFKDSEAVIGDPLALTRHDDDHGQAEERWITLGEAEGELLVVVHRYDEENEQNVCVRIISARRATPDERRQYESGKYRIQEAAMKSEYDFSQAVRGKFYREGAKFISPVHVATDVVERLSDLAAEKKMSSSDLANEILRRAIAEMDASKIG